MRRSAVALVLTIAIAVAGCAPSQKSSNPARDLSLTESELPAGVRNVMRTPDTSWGRSEVLEGSEPCFTATRNYERARDTVGLSTVSAALDQTVLRFEVTAAPISSTYVLSRFACIAEGGKSARAAWLPDDLLRRPATVIEVRTPTGRLAALEGYIDIGELSVAATSQNFKLVTNAPDATQDEVDRDQFWQLFRAQIAKVERAR